MTTKKEKALDTRRRKSKVGHDMAQKKQQMPDTLLSDEDLDRISGGGGGPVTISGGGGGDFKVK